jgi:hypothetical protein
MKDVVMVGGYQEVEVDFTADNPGLTLFHCHQQLHMDFGFMTLFDYVIYEEGELLECTPKMRHEIKGPITLNGGEQCLCPNKSIPAN